MIELAKSSKKLLFHNTIINAFRRKENTASETRGLINLKCCVCDILKRLFGIVTFLLNIEFIIYYIDHNYL